MSLEITTLKDDAEKPEGEYVRLLVVENTNLRNFILMDNTFGTQGELSNVHRHVYRFPSIAVTKGDIVVVYSGVGKNSHAPHPLNKALTVYRLYCNSDAFIWNDGADTAYVYEIKLISHKKSA